jgi:hypothetical protein
MPDHNQRRVWTGYDDRVCSEALPLPCAVLLVLEECQHRARLRRLAIPERSLALRQVSAQEMA